eukprot:TRINITY_DN66436_c0_g1_i1.p1 TRINITY_DN66436_c0_g1~~TRINITY_DN66436_c0_g1_i1.p1  ORF type:complete len:309 (-),score=52.55 TRINITY_DN66436_c0_g1_i1:66-962(-)
MGIKVREPWQGYVCSAIGSSAADFFCTPLDVVKVRMQLSQSGVVGEVYRGPIDCTRTILRNEGAAGLYKGLSPALLRASTYGSARIGFYEPIKQLIAGNKPSEELPLVSKMLAGISSGGLASFIFSPVDLVKVRMQGDREGKRYPRLFPAFASIARSEGLSGMYRGASATVGRAAMCGMVELVTYDEFKRLFIHTSWWPFADSLPTHFAASLAAGFLSTIASAPIDLVKSRMMHQPLDSAGLPSLYGSPLQCLLTTVRNEGLAGLYAGFWPNYLRLGPHTVLVFVVIEQIRHGMSWAA